MIRAALLTVVMLSWCGCTQSPGPATPPPPASLPAPATVPAAGPAAAGSAVMATVNGRPIYMEQLYRPLVEAHGLGIARMLIDNVLVEQEAAGRGVSVSGEEVEAEHRRSLEVIFSEKLTADQRQRVLEKLLARRGLTRRLWDATMRRNALLRKMVEAKVSVTEAMLKAEYARTYGEKVLLRHIQVPSLTEAEKIIRLLKQGADFADLARKYSTNTATAKDGGMLPPFSRDNASVPRAIREAAFALKPGQISEIVQVGGEFHVLKLEQRIVPPAKNYDAAKEDLRRKLRRRLVQAAQENLLRELRRKAEVEYVNPVLRRAAARAAAP